MKFNQTGWSELFTSHRSVDFTIATNDGRLSHSCPRRFVQDNPAILQSIADFFYLIRALFMSRESLERETVEMRRRIAAIEAEAAQAKIEDDDEFQP